MRFAFFSPPLSSHVAAHGALAAALRSRGHECFFLHHPSVAPLLRTNALTLAPLDPKTCEWSAESVLAHARRPGLPFGVRRVVRDMAAMTETLCRQGVSLLRDLGVDGVVSDQMESAGVLLAEHLKLPVVTVAAAMPINREPLIPLSVLDWLYEDSEKARQRNRVGESIADFLTAPLDRTIGQEAARLDIAPKAKQSDCLSPLAELSQLLPGLDFPRTNLPRHFHAVGTFREVDTARTGRLPPINPEKPFVFASLGTLQGHRLAIFRKLALACRGLGAQLLVAHCGGASEAQAATIDADWVVDRVSQAAAVARADVVVTHAGLNTVLDTLEAGKPMLCLPLAFDQPGIAARVARLGAGTVLSARAGVGAMRTALAALLSETRFRERAGSLRSEFATAGGAQAGAAIIEQAARTRLPVLRLPQPVAA